MFSNDNRTQASEQLIELLGQPYDAKQIQAILEIFGVKRITKPDSPFQDDIIWSVKASVRIDVYRSPKINKLTGRDDLSGDQWIVGAILFLAPGSDDRIKKPFPGQLPKGITMDAKPDEWIKAYGQPDIYEQGDWLGGSGPYLAWRKSGINISVEYETDEDTSVLTCVKFCLIGCMGAWRSDYPEVFAP
ncbi:hypothetical protein HNR77_001141 [Paenibacillus sp. JGP012]|uniref:hypothetical protein n=1 Tax=Paenibacillus sp. JGP012 TaxID=2735914 RepID=UPI00161E5874|nr:hypothetical protein [Paenibacillus sp. JGP012]MBB6020080.1 hypothetical protein [Paenibacillus sp. JGP012]